MSRFVRSTTRGQALVETGLVVTLLVLLSLGIVQFGYAFMQLEMITNAARDGARVGAALASRGACGKMNPADTATDTGTIATLVRSELAAVMDASALHITVTQTPEPCASGTYPNCGCIPPPTPPNFPTVDVNISGAVPYIFRLAGSGYNVNRTVRFRDERAPGG